MSVKKTALKLTALLCAFLILLSVPANAEDGTGAPPKALSAKDGFIMLDLTPEPETKNIKVLTYDEALKRTLSANNDLKKLEESFPLIEKSIELTEYQLNMAFAMEYEDFVKVVRSMEEMENSLSNAYVTKTLLSEVPEYMLRSAVSAIEPLKLDIKLLEETIALKKQNIKNLELKNKLGMASDNQVRTEKLSLDLKSEELNLKQMSLDDAYQNLSAVLKNSLTEKVSVVYEPDTAKLNIKNLNSYIEEQIKTAPTVKSAEITLQTAEYKKDTSVYSLDYGVDLISSENEYNAAKRALDDTKSNLEKNIRSLHSKIKQLEAAEKTLALNLENAVNAYNNTLISFESGNAIAYNLEEARLGIYAVEVEIQKNRINYDLLKFMIGKPYLQ